MDNSPVIIQQQPDGITNGKLEDCISGGRYVKQNSFLVIKKK